MQSLSQILHESWKQLACETGMLCMLPPQPTAGRTFLCSDCFDLRIQVLCRVRHRENTFCNNTTSLGWYFSVAVLSQIRVNMVEIKKSTTADVKHRPQAPIHQFPTTAINNQRARFISDSVAQFPRRFRKRSCGGRGGRRLADSSVTEARV